MAGATFGTLALRFRGKASMGQNPSVSPTWRQAIHAVSRAWMPLVIYEALVSLLKAVLLGPLLVTLSYRLIEFTGEPVLGNAELARFLLSPRGALALLLGLSILLALVLIEYSGLILLLRAALRGEPASVRQVIGAMFAAAPRLLGLAIVQTTCSLLVALPFLGLAGVTYWLLLSGTDINYYLYERPPRFWLAAILGAALALGLIASTAWFFLRFALAVPACVFERQGVFSSLRSSVRLIRGRAARLLLVIVAWLLLEQVLLIATIAGLERINGLLAARFEDRLTMLVWSAVTLLLFDAIVLQLIGAFFAIGRALVITVEYEQARRSVSPSPALADAPAPAAPPPASGTARAAVMALLILGPAASLIYAVGLARAFIEYRPVLVTAHRAGSSLGPENSILALERSIAAGADFVEIDVQQSADGHVVLMHDRDLRRTTGDPRNVNEVTLAELKQLRLRDARGKSSESIPTLDEFLLACDEKIRLNVELKETDRQPGLAQAVVRVLNNQDFSRASVSSFRLPPLVEISGEDVRIPVGMILSAVQGDMTRLPVAFLSLNQRIVQADLVRRAHARHKEVHAWTVNDRSSAIRLMDLGCDNLITSDPVLMREVVDWYAGLGDVERMLMRLRRWMRE